MSAVLLDTHALIWWTTQPDLLGIAAREALADPATRVRVSAVSAMEIATKHRIGKLPIGARLASSFAADVGAEGFELLAVTAEHALRAGSLDIPHNNPWDRLLIAQAEIEGLALVSNERRFSAWGVDRLW